MLRWFSRKPAPITGVPAVRRQKTYSAESGYVYQYFYEGHRSYRACVEYVFNVSADRKSSLPVSVFLEDNSVTDWHRRHGRALTETERYAVAKLALFQAFDERVRPALLEQPILVRAADVEAILERLDLE